MSINAKIHQFVNKNGYYRDGKIMVDWLGESYVISAFWAIALSKNLFG